MTTGLICGFGCADNADPTQAEASAEPVSAPAERSTAANGNQAAHSQPDAQPAAPASLAFRNVRLFDGVRTIPAANVIVRGETIAEVGPDAVIPEGAATIDGAGKTLLPGFIDCHTHTFFREQLEQAAVFGVTTELDMAGNPQFADQMRAQQKSGEARDRADLLSAGTPVTARGGHPTQIRWFAQIPTLDAPDEAAVFIDARIREGSDYIKLIYDDGTVYGLKLPTLSRETLEGAAQAAQERDRLAVAHIATREGARDAIEAGVDGLVHLFLDQPPDDELLELAREKNVFVIPTLTVLQSAGGTAGGTSLIEHPELKPYLTPDDLSNLRSAFPRQQSSQVRFAVARQAARELAKAGVPILAGTDAPNPGTVHGASIHRELELLVDAGLTPEQALAGATSRPARHFALSDRGRIAKDRRADLVLVEGDPTRDIADTRRIVGVWKQGRPIDRAAYRDKVAAAIAQSDGDGAPVPPGSEAGLVSDFEGTEVSAAFGSGWTVSTDLFVGGKSQAEFRLAQDGAGDSQGALEIAGTIEDRPQPRWAGVTFSPGRTVMAPADLSAKKALSFSAKGDGKTYYVMLFFQQRGFFPSTKTFTAGEEWKQHRFELKAFDGCDGTDVTGVFFGSGEETGPFKFRIDDVRFE